jgi:Predicted Zn-dependent protease
LIPQFGKPLPLDASNKGPAQGWTSNPAGAAGNTAVQSTMGDGGPMNDETRVARLEKIAFGSTYPEHEVEDRLDHLEKEIFGDKSTGELNTRIMRLESKLGGKGAFGGNTRGSADVPNGNYRQRGSTGEAPLTAKALDMASVLGFSSNASPGNSKSTESAQNPRQTGSLPASDSSATGANLPATGTNTATDSTSSATSDESNLAAILTPSSSPTTDQGSQAANENDLASLIRTADSPAREVARAMPYDKESGDYLDLVKTWDDDKRARFNRFPIRVRLPEDSPDPWRKSMISGVERWGKYIPLSQAKKTESADIEVSWVNHLVPNVLGVTRLTATSGNINVRVFMLRPTHYLPVVPQKALSGAFLHELGHALGIFGHSKDKDDLMFAFEIGPRNKLTQDEDGSISNRDVNTLKRIYEGKALPRSFNLDKPIEWSLCANAS